MDPRKEKMHFGHFCCSHSRGVWLHQCALRHFAWLVGFGVVQWH